MSATQLEGPPAGQFPDDYGYGGSEPDYSPAPQGQAGGGALVHVGDRLPMPADCGIQPRDWKVLTDAIWPGAKTSDAVKLAFDYCMARHLDPFKRPVHIVPMWNAKLRCEVETVWPGISELQTTAARTGEWAGMDDARWGPEIKRTFNGRKKEVDRKTKRETWVDFSVTLSYPEWCSVTVYRLVKGERQAFSEQVFWEEYYATQGKWSDVPNDMWSRRPRGQLLKCAKAASLRAAFPEEMGSTYAAEEMEGKDTDGGVVIPGTAETIEETKPELQRGSKMDALAAQLGAKAASGKAVDRQRDEKVEDASSGSVVDQPGSEGDGKESGQDEKGNTHDAGTKDSAEDDDRLAEAAKAASEAAARAAAAAEQASQRFADDFVGEITAAAQKADGEQALAGVVGNRAIATRLGRLRAGYPTKYWTVVRSFLRPEVIGKIDLIQQANPQLFEDIEAKRAQAEEESGGTQEASS
jgi:phage recombination protein Bet